MYGKQPATAYCLNLAHAATASDGNEFRYLDQMSRLCARENTFPGEFNYQSGGRNILNRLIVK